MTLDEAINTACDSVGIIAPSRVQYGRWIKTNTLSGKNGKGDGRVIINETHVSAFNWQTGETKTVALRDSFSPTERRQISQQIRESEERKREQAIAATGIATQIVRASVPCPHPYLKGKGFPDENVLVLDKGSMQEIVGKRSDYLMTEGGKKAIVVPARIGSSISSVQLIWENGEKRFLYGGIMEGASHRVASGSFTWMCEGFATALSLRAVIKGLHRTDAVLCCFSAYNTAEMAKALGKRSAIVTDNDKPLPQYERLGTGEYFARRSGRPYFMPPRLGEDLNDLHMREGIFAVQRALSDFLKSLPLESRGAA